MSEPEGKYDGFEKQVGVIGHMAFQFDFDYFILQFEIEKVFGLMAKGTNSVFKFKLVVMD